MPVRSELSDQQKRVLDQLPREGLSLIVGPPGTGKTVIGMWRALELTRRGTETVRFVCFNKVLKSHSSTWSNESFQKVHVSTVHSFGGELCKIVSGSRSWPTRAGASDIYDIDWIEIGRMCKESEKTKDLGHLIVDEGQDQHPDFYFAMSLLVHLGWFKSLTVLADENQRITQQNSSIDQIRTKMRMASMGQGVNEESLTENFRNTLQIAKLSLEFHVGGSSGQPELPTHRPGEEPSFGGFHNLDKMAKRIATLSNNDASRSFLVVCGNQASASDLLELIRTQLKNLGSSSQQVTRYQRNDEEWGDESKLRVGDPGVIAIVHDTSMKGLEADTCIIADIDLMNDGHADVDVEKMTFYVATSRARTSLEIFYKSPASRFTREMYAVVESHINLRSKDAFERAQGGQS